MFLPSFFITFYRIASFYVSNVWLQSQHIWHGYLSELLLYMELPNMVKIRFSQFAAEQIYLQTISDNTIEKR